MTDIVAENLWVDGMVAKAPNLPLICDTLPVIPPYVGRILTYSGDAFRGVTGWDSGIQIPDRWRFRYGVASVPNGDIVILVTATFNLAIPPVVVRNSGGVWGEPLGLGDHWI